jgi:hypothetical protein
MLVAHDALAAAQVDDDELRAHVVTHPDSSKTYNPRYFCPAVL